MQERGVMPYVMVSACLLGRKVRYDGNALPLDDDILAMWRRERRIVSVCPEVEAGMATPRAPAEIIAGDGARVLAGEAEVWEKEGDNVTRGFIAGASLALARCREYGIRVAVLTESSPSCGSSTIYDGRFAGHKIAGMGVTAALLCEHGIQVFSQHELAHAQAALHQVAR